MLLIEYKPKAVPFVLDTSRIDAGYEHESNDCVVRSYAAAMKIDYKKAHKFFADRFNRFPGGGVVVTDMALANYLTNRYECLIYPVRCNPHYMAEIDDYGIFSSAATLAEVVKDHPTGSYLAWVSGGHHVVAIVDGLMHDMLLKAYTRYDFRVCALWKVSD